MYNPKVSIIIPVYNGSNFIKEAIDSALVQTYRNIEIIVVNDGSNDDGATEEIVKSYGSKVRYYKKKNGGVATALNLGIKKMTGEYFSWLSHDDMYYPKKVEKQINKLGELDNKKVVLYSNYSLLKCGLITPVYHNHEMLIRKKKYSLLRGCVNGITTLVPKSIIEEVGLFDEGLRCTQDYDFWQRIQKKYDFIHMEDVLSITRLHGDQDSVVSPNAQIEGDALWISMVKNLTNKEKKQYESTLYNFYFEMIKFLKETPYIGALNYCRERLERLEKKYSQIDLGIKVSVVIPFFNRPKDTITSIKSVLDQTYENIEIILVNDASTEDVSEVNHFVYNNKSIKLINADKNAGPATARNIGIKAATGDYVAFLDSDDEFLEDKIQHQLLAMSKHNLDISYTPYIRRYDRDEKSDVIKGGFGMTGIVVPKIISSCPIATPTIMVRRSILIEGNIFFDETIRIGEDTCYWLELAKSHEILLVDEPMTIVNVNSGSHAYDNEKFVVGLRNILAYLFNDKYYSSYYYDISLLCNDYHTVNKSVMLNRENDLYINNNAIVKVSISLRQRLSGTIAYRVARKIYREGLMATWKASISKVKQGIDNVAKSFNHHSSI